MKYLFFRTLIGLLVLTVHSCATKNIPVGTGNNAVIKVMSYNVHHCNPPSKSGVIDLDAVAQVLKKEGADIVALQEIDVNTTRSGKIDEAEQLALKAGYPFFFFARAIDFGGGSYGVAILSRYKLIDTKIHPLPTDTSTNGEHRTIAIAQVSLPNGKTIHFASTHLDVGRNEINRLLQMKEINKVAGQISGPFVIAGDFNSSEGSETINLLDEEFTRTCEKCKSENGPERVIDFIGYRPGEKFSVVSHRVIPEQYASDHFPIVAAIQLKF
jgi:endonuclease/exonuclease/phosphatase family metal-dependent hydrolase